MAKSKGFFGGGLLKLYRTPHSKHWTAKVEDHPILRQLTTEAGLKGKIYITDAEYDAVLAAAGKHGISIQTTYPEKEEDMTKSKQLLNLLEGDDDSGEEEYDDSNEPQSDDIILSPSGRLGGKVAVQADGKSIGEFSDEEEAEVAIVKWINSNKFYPNIWWQDDHGGIEKYTLEPKNLKKIKV